jgi:hypothetical protein
MIAVAETRSIKGTEERLYKIMQPPHLNEEDVQQFSKEEHLRHFASFLAFLLQGFSNYLDRSRQFYDDRAGYHENTLYASTEEMDELRRAIQKIFSQLQPDGEKCRNRRKRKFVIISHPIDYEGDENGSSNLE